MYALQPVGPCGVWGNWEFGCEWGRYWALSHPGLAGMEPGPRKTGLPRRWERRRDAKLRNDSFEQHLPPAGLRIIIVGLGPKRKPLECQRHESATLVAQSFLEQPGTTTGTHKRKGRHAYTDSRSPGGPASPSASYVCVRVLIQGAWAFWTWRSARRTA